MSFCISNAGYFYSALPVRNPIYFRDGPEEYPKGTSQKDLYRTPLVIYLEQKPHSQCSFISDKLCFPIQFFSDLASLLKLCRGLSKGEAETQEKKMLIEKD